MFVVRGNFLPETSKEKRRLVTKLRNTGVKVDTYYTNKVQVRYLGDDLKIIAMVIDVVSQFKTHEIEMHEL